MGSLLVVTGPPGAGKSVVGRGLAARTSPSVLVEGDAFFAFLASGAIEPWLPESETQNGIVADAAARATGRFAADYDVVYDGVVGPWSIGDFALATGLDSIDYVVLLPTEEVCVERVRTRTGHGFTDERAARHMHDQFARSGIGRRHVIDPGDSGVDVLVDRIDAQRAAGTFAR